MPTPCLSMTAFANLRGQGTGDLSGLSWVWDIRSVNGKGLDLRMRLPDGIEGLEPAVRADLTRRFHRGSIAVSLKLSRDAGAETMRVNPQALNAALVALAQVQQAADGFVILAAPSAADVLTLRGVMETTTQDDADPVALRAALLADLTPVLDSFAAMRTQEGEALARILTAQLTEVATLIDAAKRESEARRDATADTLRANLARVLDAVDADPARVAQELALIAVKADITEELDRLTAHVAAARALIAQGGAMGRKFDFLTQEFNREANTLCSKAQAIALTRIGLDLKHIIDQMREQVQNLE
ncbi:MAG: YicC/YloC family endoribonuclease [Gemmobacter sp.]|nr:YicC/YloC family endoribonuclease [Gemmobacter sp.]